MNESYEITVTNAPLPYTTETLLNQLNTGNNLGTQLSTNLCFCFCFVSAFYILFLIKERESRSKLLQFVSGVNVWIFWISQFLWDILTFTLTAVIVACTIACFQEDGFSTFGDLGMFFLLWRSTIDSYRRSVHSHRIKDNNTICSVFSVYNFSSVFPGYTYIWLFCASIYVPDFVILLGTIHRFW